MPRGKIIRSEEAFKNLSTLTGRKTFCPDRKLLPAGDLGVVVTEKHLDVEVLNVERVVFNEFSTGFDVFTH
jgi:hypothetical protein